MNAGWAMWNLVFGLRKVSFQNKVFTFQKRSNGPINKAIHNWWKLMVLTWQAVCWYKKFEIIDCRVQIIRHFTMKFTFAKKFASIFDFKCYSSQVLNRSHLNKQNLAQILPNYCWILSDSYQNLTTTSSIRIPMQKNCMGSSLALIYFHFY